MGVWGECWWCWWCWWCVREVLGRGWKIWGCSWHPFMLGVRLIDLVFAGVCRLRGACPLRPRFLLPVLPLP